MEQGAKTFTVKKIEKLIDLKEDVEALIECIKSLESKATVIGEGGCAVIFALLDGKFDEICLKKIREKPHINYNNIDQEHDFQVGAKKAGVRTPLSIYWIKAENETYLIMERVKGYNLAEVLRNPNLLSKKFDFKIFCDSLDDQVKKMHSAGIYHRDFKLENVMIDEEGLPVIIDWGTATNGTGSENTYEETVSIYDHKKGRYGFVNGYFKDDLVMVKNIKASLKPLIRQD